MRRVVLRLTGFNPDEQDQNEGVTREVSSAVRSTLRYFSRSVGSVIKSRKSENSVIEEEPTSQASTLEEIISIEVTEEEEEATKTKLTEEEVNNIVDNVRML